MGRHRNQIRPCIPLFDGNTYLSVNDATVLSNLSGLSTGIFFGTFKLVNDYPQHILQSLTNSNATGDYICRAEVRPATSENSIGVRISHSLGALTFHINQSLISYNDLCDDRTFWIYEIIIDGVNNRIRLSKNFGSWVTYQDSDLIFSTGNKTTSIFTDTIVNKYVIGGNSIVFDGSFVEVALSKGLISNTGIKLVDGLTTLYSVKTECKNFIASAETEKITT